MKKDSVDACLIACPSLYSSSSTPPAAVTLNFVLNSCSALLSAVCRGARVAYCVVFAASCDVVRGLLVTFFLVIHVLVFVCFFRVMSFFVSVLLLLLLFSSLIMVLHLLLLLLLLSLLLLLTFLLYLFACC